MKLSELKDKILNNTLDNSILIFTWEDSDFLVKQYIHEIAKRNGQTIQYVDTYESLFKLATSENFFDEDDEDSVLNVLDVESFDVLADDRMSELTNSIIVCNKITKEVTHSYDNYPNLIVNFPKLEPWQIKDYMKVICGGLSEDSIDKLYNLTSSDIYRIDNELGKIGCFPKESQDKLFKEMVSNGAYNDLIQLTTFNLTNAIIKRDMTTIGDAIRNLQNIDIDAIGLATILHRNIKNIIDIQMNSSATPESLGMSEKQFKAIKYYNCGKISNEKLIDLLNFLDEIDFKLKSGRFDLNEENKISYIVLKMLER